MNSNWSICCDNLIGCCVANIDSSKFRVKKCHQTASPNCVNNLFVTNCFKMCFVADFFLSHAHFMLPKSDFSNFSNFYPECSVYVLQSENSYGYFMFFGCFYNSYSLDRRDEFSRSLLEWNLWFISLWFFIISVGAISIKTSLTPLTWGSAEDASSMTMHTLATNATP